MSPDSPALRTLLVTALAACGSPPGAETLDAALDLGAPDSGLDGGADAGLDGGLDGGAGGNPRVVFSSNRSGDYTLYVTDLGGLASTAIAVDPAIDLQPAPSADGRQIAFASSRLGPIRVFVYEIESEQLRLASAEPTLSASPCFSPDMQWIVYEGRSAPGGTPDIYRVPGAGGAVERLTIGEGANSGPVYSHDGASVYFVSNRSGSNDVWRMDANGANAVAVPGAEDVLGRPAVDPDGSRIAVTRVTEQISRVDAIDLVTGLSTTLTDQNDSEPSFAPGALLVSSMRFGNPEVLLLSLPALTATRLTDDGQIDGQAAFLPVTPQAGSSL